MKAKIETFYWGKIPVRVAKVADCIANTTGTIVTTDVGEEIALYSQRRVRRPEPGYRYHEFRRR